MKNPIVVIANPCSAGGQTARIWPEIERHLVDSLGLFQTRWTERPGHAIDLAREAARGGCEVVVAVGGDGTINEVINGLIESQRGREITFGLIPRGTGSDFRRAIGLSRSLAQAALALRRRQTRIIDAGRVYYSSRDGGRQQRYFCNVTSFGVGGAAADRVSRSSKALGGRLTFLLATAASLFKYRNQRIQLTLDGQPLAPFKALHIAVGNGSFHGGGMRVCPRADLADGLFDVTIIGDVSPLEVASRAYLLYNGQIYTHSKVDFYRAREIVARSDETVWIEIDGEPLGKLPLEITVLPKALRVIVPGASDE